MATKTALGPPWVLRDKFVDDKPTDGVGDPIGHAEVQALSRRYATSTRSTSRKNRALSSSQKLNWQKGHDPASSAIRESSHLPRSWHNGPGGMSQPSNLLLIPGVGDGPRDASPGLAADGSVSAQDAVATRLAGHAALSCRYNFQSFVGDGGSALGAGAVVAPADER